MRALSRPLLAIVLLAALAGGCTTDIRRLSDDARDREASLWVHTPFVTIGNDLVLEVGVYDDPRVGLQEVKAFVGDHQVAEASGRGRYWGDQITTSDDSIIWEDSDFVQLHIPVLGHAGTVLPLRIEVSYASAMQLGSSFMNRDETATMKVEVPIMSATMRTARRALSGLMGLAILAIAGLLLRRHGSQLAASGSHDNGGFIMLVLVVWTAIGYWWFAERLVIATGLYDTWFRAVATVVWVAVPPIFAHLLARRAERALPSATVVSGGEEPRREE